MSEDQVVGSKRGSGANKLNAGMFFTSKKLATQTRLRKHPHLTSFPLPRTFSTALPRSTPPALGAGCCRLGSWRPRGDSTNVRCEAPFAPPGVRGSGGGMRSNAVELLLLATLPALGVAGEGAAKRSNRWLTEEAFSLPSVEADEALLLSLPRETAALVDDPTPPPPLQTLMGSAATFSTCPCPAVAVWQKITVVVAGCRSSSVNEKSGSFFASVRSPTGQPGGEHKGL